jgi:hypothetical protein
MEVFQEGVWKLYQPSGTADTFFAVIEAAFEVPWLLNPPSMAIASGLTIVISPGRLLALTRRTIALGSEEQM